MDLHRLAAPFPKSAIHWRIQGKPYERDGKHTAMALAYIDARDVMDRLDEVCTPANWQSRFSETAKGRVIGEIGIRIGDDWVWKADGAGDTAVEGEKGGISDALKRAAVNWGIGRYLYSLGSPWCPCNVKENGTFKSWIGSPWEHLKDAPQEATAHEILATVQAISACGTMEALAKCWSETSRNARHIAESQVVYEAKEARKAELQQQAAA